MANITSLYTYKDSNGGLWVGTACGTDDTYRDIWWQLINPDGELATYGCFEAKGGAFIKVRDKIRKAIKHRLPEGATLRMVK